MKYTRIETGVFLQRPNRFIAHVLCNGREEIVHVKNTGRCRELLTENAKVILEEGQNPKRKTKYSLVAVYKGEMLVNMDSQAPNAAAGEALRGGRLKEIGVPTLVRPETRFGDSRFDFYYETPREKGFLEVKGVTLEDNGLAMFPDAPTERGTRHLKELVAAKKAGFAANVLFLVQMKGPTAFCANAATDPAFAAALDEAVKNGVRLLVYDCQVTPSSMAVDLPLI